MNIYHLISIFGKEAPTNVIVGWIVWFSCFFILLLLGFLFTYIFTGKNKRQRKLKERLDFNVRIFTYNYATQTFYSFDKMNISHTKTFTMDEFYNQFTRQDKYLVEDWLRSIAHNEAHLDYIQADIILSSSKKVSSSMLELTSVNRQKATIHFVSHLLSNMYSINLKNVMLQKNRISSKYILSNIEDAQKFMEKGSDEALGALFYCKLYRKKGNVEGEDTELIELNKKIRLVINHFLNKKRKIAFVSSYDFVLIDKECISKIAAMTIGSTLHTQIQQYLNKNTNGDTFEVAIGITNNLSCDKNFSLGKEQAYKMATAIEKGFSKDKILFYDESFFTNYQQAREQKDEIRMVVKNGTIRNYFTPTLNTQNGTSPFYILKTFAYGTSVKDFTQTILIAKEIGIVNKLFSCIINKVIQIQKINKTPCSIAITIPYSTINDFTKAIQEVNYPQVSWIILVKETDLLTTREDALQMSRTFHDLTKAGYKFGLIIESSFSGLRTRILRTMSYFFIPPQFTSESNDLNRSRTDLRNIQLLYSLYRVPLVYFGLKDISNIELGVHYGGTIFQCAKLKALSSHMEQIDENIIKNVLTEAKNLAPKTLENLRNNH